VYSYSSISWEGVKSYTSVSNTSQMRFSGWSKLTPTLRIKYVFSRDQLFLSVAYRFIRIAAESISFARDGRFVNLARVSPLDIVGRPVANEASKFDICVNDGAGLCSALCVSPLVVTESHILSPNSNTGTHNVSGIFHTYEWQRYAGLLGLLTSTPIVYTYMYASAVSFGTFGRPPRAAVQRRSFVYPQNHRLLTHCLRWT